MLILYFWNKTFFENDWWIWLRKACHLKYAFIFVEWIAAVINSTNERYLCIKKVIHIWKNICNYPSANRVELDVTKVFFNANSNLRSDTFSIVVTSQVINIYIWYLNNHFNKFSSLMGCQIRFFATCQDALLKDRQKQLVSIQPINYSLFAAFILLW